MSILLRNWWPNSAEVCWLSVRGCPWDARAVCSDRVLYRNTYLPLRTYPERERKQLLAAGAGAGLSAAFAAPLSSSLLVIESIERFDAPKTAITTLLAGVVAGGVASWMFPTTPYHLISAVVPGLSFIRQAELYIIFAALMAVIAKFYSLIVPFFQERIPAMKLSIPVKMLYLLIIAYAISLTETNLTGGGEQFLMMQE